MPAPEPVSTRRSTRIQRYHLRASIAGILHFTCPWCGTSNAIRLTPAHWMVTCTGVNAIHAATPCNGSFIPGITLYPIPPGRPRRPQDYVVPNGSELIDMFPLGELNRDPWRGGQRVHAVYGVEQRKEIETVERFLERAAAEGGVRDMGRVSVLMALAVQTELERMRAVAGLGLTPTPDASIVAAVKSALTYKQKQKPKPKRR